MFRVTQDTATPTLASHTGLSPSMMHLSRCFRSQLPYDSAVLQPQRCVATTLVWALPRSLATTRGIIVYFLFLQVLRCFSSPCALRYFLAVQQHFRDAVAHTFSCILVLNLIAKIKDRNLSLRFYSLACVNMSKIF